MSAPVDRRPQYTALYDDGRPRTLPRDPTQRDAIRGRGSPGAHHPPRRRAVGPRRPRRVPWHGSTCGAAVRRRPSSAR